MLGPSPRITVASHLLPCFPLKSLMYTWLQAQALQTALEMENKQVQAHGVGQRQSYTRSRVS